MYCLSWFIRCFVCLRCGLELISVTDLGVIIIVNIINFIRS